ncbi:60S ribosomal protein L26, putative [Entamoeba invadens IP1]|uniref:60S ribosomal protein L26, putative n=1 Tax=Entamoeba invadens IP1 TaxID=370355 RepID=UPI0002C3E2F6|nr:60S ribosomal protein L26, putative [Entamoeba invadens IP1]ELP90487.1 60S ribosomal protein L26, putative [Entamoeba invadens IP1]|eukprot:XP_004257258.1 60S ribosomal protein L26, putative [Entamoeba invadens IP1]
MKFNPRVSSQPRKARKAFYNANKNQRRILMSARLSKELREKYTVKALPIHKDDEVKIIRGHQKIAGKVTGVRRSQYVIYIDKLTKTKNNGQTVQVPVHVANVEITKPFLNKDREALLKKRGDAAKAYKESVAKKNEQVEEVFKKAYPTLSFDIFSSKNKVEAIKEKKPLRLASRLIAVKAMANADRAKYTASLKLKNARDQLAAYKAALAKKIAK